MNRAGHSSSLSSRSCGGYFLDVVIMGARCPRRIQTAKLPDYIASHSQADDLYHVEEECSTKWLYTSAIPAKDQRMLGRRGDWCSCRSSRAEGFVDVALARGWCNLSTRWCSKASSSCTIPSIEKKTNKRTSTPQPRNEDRQESRRRIL